MNVFRWCWFLAGLNYGWALKDALAGQVAEALFFAAFALALSVAGEINRPRLWMR
jgi:hypothetical protein